MNAEDLKVELPKGFIEEVVNKQLNAHIADIIAKNSNNIYRSDVIVHAIKSIFKESTNGPSRIEVLIQEQIERVVDNAVWNYFKENKELEKWLHATIDSIVKSEACQKEMVDKLTKRIVSRTA